ncbi:MAG: DUF2306 domain-containing protein [Calditrichaeota bacterium]|nr:DUF2306 domain-containing protein [Calditrichota bacterium]
MFDIANWVHSTIGGIHFVSSVIGLCTGAYILLTKKGTRIHKKTGYVFVVSLVLVNLSALFIYDFNDGSISVFHFLIPVSVIFLSIGFIPMLGERKANYLNRHIIGMNGAALGLWAAGATEYFVRELAHGLSRNELMAYSFAISMQFAILITVSITYHIKRYQRPAK